MKNANETVHWIGNADRVFQIEGTGKLVSEKNVVRAMKAYEIFKEALEKLSCISDYSVEGRKARAIAEKAIKAVM